MATSRKVANRHETVGRYHGQQLPRFTAGKVEPNLRTLKLPPSTPESAVVIQKSIRIYYTYKLCFKPYEVLPIHILVTTRGGKTTPCNTFLIIRRWMLIRQPFSCWNERGGGWKLLSYLKTLIWFWWNCKIPPFFSLSSNRIRHRRWFTRRGPANSDSSTSF